MPSLQHFLFTIFAICLLTIGICSASNANARVPRSPTYRDKANFQDLLETVEPASLHDVLHEHMDKYKHGVFQEDKVAMAVVHQEAPEVATSLVELAKRQVPTGNSSVVTTTTAVTTESTSTVVSSITSSTVVTSSSASSSTPVTSSSDTTPSPTTTPPTTSSSEVATTTPLSTTKGYSTSLPTSVLPSSGSNIPTDSSEPQSSPSPTSQPVTSLQIYTTTLPNGKASTVTQTTVVPAGQPDQTGAAGQSSKTGPIASLQTNGGSKEKTGMGVLMGMIVIAVLITS